MRNHLVNNQNILNLDITENQSNNTTMFFKTKEANVSNILEPNPQKQLKFPDKILEVDEDLLRQSSKKSVIKTQKMLSTTNDDHNLQIKPNNFCKNILTSNKKKKIIQVEGPSSPECDSSLDISMKFEVTPNLKKLLKRKNYKEVKKSKILTQKPNPNITILSSREVSYRDNMREMHDVDILRNDMERIIDIKIKRSLEQDIQGLDFDYNSRENLGGGAKGCGYLDRSETSLLSNGKDPLKDKFLTNLADEESISQPRILDKLEVIHQMDEMNSIEKGQKFVSLKISDSFDKEENKAGYEDISDIKYRDEYEIGDDTHDASRIMKGQVKIKKLPLNRIKDQTPYYSLVTIRRNSEESYGSNYSYGGETKSFLNKIRDLEFKKGSKASRGFREYLGECKDQAIITNIMNKQLSDLGIPKKKFILDKNRRSN